MQKLMMTAALCLSVTLLTSTPVMAKKTQMQNIDFGAITCDEFMQEMSKSSSEDVGVVLMWIDGYLSGVSGDTILNWENLEEFSADLVAYCNSKPNAKVLDAAEEVGIEE